MRKGLMVRARDAMDIFTVVVVDLCVANPSPLLGCPRA